MDQQSLSKTFFFSFFANTPNIDGSIGVAKKKKKSRKLGKIKDHFYSSSQSVLQTSLNEPFAPSCCYSTSLSNFFQIHCHISSELFPNSLSSSSSSSSFTNFYVFIPFFHRLNIIIFGKNFLNTYSNNSYFFCSYC